MMKSNRWLLPEGIEEVLPQQARQLESMRRSLLDLFQSWGYDLVMPPFIEYIESLLTGTGNDLDLQTFKLTDQLTGRMMGVRADMTPQVARIDAHHLKSSAPTRLCYLGTVLHTRPGGFAGSRSLLQVGAELFGHAGIESDVEVLSLMVETLKQAGVEDLYLDLGHVGVYRGLVDQAGLDADQEALLFDALQRKAKPEITDLLNDWSLPKVVAEMLTKLTDLNGNDSVLTEARGALKKASKPVQHALDNLQQIAALLQQRLPDLNLHYDLAELRGYHYHTGAVFAAYVPGRGQAIAQGGRYDGIGRAFGLSRPATGFSTDLRILAVLSQQSDDIAAGILAPAVGDAELQSVVQELRAAGERVIIELPGQQGDAIALGCDRRLVKITQGWEVKPV
ncbi:MAG: ATP phosphoribosyltransferase regulatory subunit [Gammaproteobacteria bacterium]|nr:ATP phosphoribosyltransferase regulatory subunit [Gammaproteobacteria bacterium]